MTLIDLVLKEHYKTLSVVGMEKNVGKTVVLNELLEQVDEKSLVPGITSIGRDGESKDVLTETDKPLIYVSKGTLVATLEMYINLADIEVEVLEITNQVTSMGRVIIGRCLQSGYIEVAGPASNNGIKDVADKMLAYGANLVIVDGALSRVSSASPGITEATILATGAVLDRDMKKVISKTFHQVHLFGLKGLKNNEVIALIEEKILEDGITFIENGLKTHHLKLKTALNASRKIIEEITSETKYIVFSGSLTSKIIKEIHQACGGTDVIFVVKDATKIFISERELNYFLKIGIQLRVLDEINLLALTINPYSPYGYNFNPKEFMKTMESYFEDIPIFNVLESGS
jgi:hypothetical protein